MINEAALLGFINLEVQDKSTLAWTDILAEAIQVNSVRGGELGVAGVSTTDVGTITILIKNAYDPSLVNTIMPQASIRLYSTLTSTHEDGAIFTGTVDDIGTERILNYNGELDTYVTIFASDAVQAHVNKIVPGISSSDGLGYQTWDGRISDLTPYATETVVVSAPIVYKI